MNCETCNGCGKKCCPDDMTSLSIGYRRVCPECVKKIDEFIEGLKPKVTVYSHDGYCLEAVSCIGSGVGQDGCTAHCNVIHLRQDAADALYEYMRRERENK